MFHQSGVHERTGAEVGNGKYANGLFIGTHTPKRACVHVPPHTLTPLTQPSRTQARLPAMDIYGANSRGWQRRAHVSIIYECGASPGYDAGSPVTSMIPDHVTAGLAGWLPARIATLDLLPVAPRRELHEGFYRALWSYLVPSLFPGGDNKRLRKSWENPPHRLSLYVLHVIFSAGTTCISSFFDIKLFTQISFIVDTQGFGETGYWEQIVTNLLVLFHYFMHHQFVWRYIVSNPGDAFYEPRAFVVSKPLSSIVDTQGSWWNMSLEIN